MNTDFKDAHDRHWLDAELLFSSNRWANADHLYGLAAECGLKCLMLAFGMTLDHGHNMPQDQRDRKHANGILARYETYRCGHPRGAHYALPASNPFSDWDVSQRYANRSNFGRMRAQSHQAGANTVRQMINKATRDGLI